MMHQAFSDTSPYPFGLELEVGILRIIIFIMNERVLRHHLRTYYVHLYNFLFSLIKFLEIVLLYQIKSIDVV